MRQLLSWLSAPWCERQDRYAKAANAASVQPNRANWWGAIAFLVPFAIYAFSLVPGVEYWDTGEMQTVPYIFGISHPTGFPVFVFVGWLFSHVFILGSVAWRLNVMSAAAMAAAAWLVYATVRDFDESEPVALGGAFLFALGEVVWIRATRAEVHTFAVALGALCVWQLLRWYRTGEPRALYFGALGFGLGLANHGIATLLAPGIAMLVLPRLGELTARRVGTATALVAAPLLLYLYIPIRSAMLFAARVDPTLALGLEPGRPFWDFEHPATLGQFLHYLGGGDSSQVGTGFSRMFSIESYPEVAARFFSAAVHEFGLVALFFAAIGFALLARRDAWLALAFVVTCGLCIPYGLLYPEADPERYLLLAFWGIAVLSSLGTAWGLAAYFARRDIVVTLAATLLIAGSAFGLYWSGREIFGQRNDTGAYDYTNRVIAGTPDDGIIVVNWTYATPLGYAAYVEKRLGHRIVVTAYPSDYSEFYPGWLKTRRIFLVNQPSWTDPKFSETIVTNDPTVVELHAR